MKNGRRQHESTASRRLSLRTGVSLTEVTVALLLLGVFASVAVPRLSASLDGQRIRAAAFRIAAELNMARRDAKTRSINRDVDFNVANNRYDLVGMTHPDEPGELYRVELEEGLYPVTLTVADFTNDLDETDEMISFDMYGKPSSSDEPLVSGIITVESDGKTASVVIDPITGRASVQ